MNLDHLYYYCSLVETQNYSIAARELYIAQSTLSLAISNLENELGTSLIKRKRPVVELTEEGEHFYRAVVAATQILNRAVLGIQERGSRESTTIRIGVVYSAQHGRLTNAIMKFADTINGNVKFSWKQGTTVELMKALKSHSLDVIIAGVLGKDSVVTSFPCWSHRGCLIVNKNSHFASKKKVSLNDLKGIQLLSYGKDAGPFKHEMISIFRDYPNLRIAHDFNDEITLCSLVAANVDVMAVSCHSQLVESFNEVVAIEIEELPEIFHQFYMSYLKDAQQTRVIKRFLCFFKEYDYAADKNHIW